MTTQRLSRVLPLIALVLVTGASAAQAGDVASALGAYWDFETYTLGTNPTGFPGGSNRGSFIDISGNGNTAYAGDLGGAIGGPPQSAAGRFGNSFYSKNNGNNGALAVAAHSATLNIDIGESFTISVWQKVGTRAAEPTSGFPVGRGRSSIFGKVANFAVEGENGLHYEINDRIRIQTNDTGNFGQTTKSSTPHNQVDNGQWAHHLISGTFNPVTNNVDFKTFINGTHVAALDTSIAASILDNEGYFSIGGLWRTTGTSTTPTNATQRFLSWNTGEGFIDDFARFDNLAFTDAEAMAVYNLAQETALNYDMGKVIQLLDLHRDGVGIAEIDGLTWRFTDDAELFTGALGSVTSANGDFFLQLGDGTGVTTMLAVPEPASVAVWSLIGVGLAAGGMWRRRRGAQ